MDTPLPTRLAPELAADSTLAGCGRIVHDGVHEALCEIADLGEKLAAGDFTSPYDKAEDATRTRRTPHERARRRFIPREIADQIHAELIERMRTGAVALAAKLARLARRDPAAFEREWCARVERLAAEALEQMRADIRRGSAPERHWLVSQ